MLQVIKSVLAAFFGVQSEKKIASAIFSNLLPCLMFWLACCWLVFLCCWSG